MGMSLICMPTESRNPQRGGIQQNLNYEAGRHLVILKQFEFTKS